MTVFISGFKTGIGGISEESDNERFAVTDVDVLPSRKECYERIVAGTSTALHRFIIANEPASAAAMKDFRAQLAELILEITGVR